MDERDRVAAESINANIYSCIPYLPASAGILAGRALRFSPLALLYSARVANLLVYALLVSIALVMLPDFHLLALALTVMPTCLHVAASASGDGMTIGATLLFCAYVLRLAYDDSVVRIGWRHQSALGALVLLFSLCKFNVWQVLMVLLIPARKFGNRRTLWLSLAGYVLLACASGAGWQYANRANIQVFEVERGARGVHLAQNLRFVQDHPAAFGKLVVRTVRNFQYLYLAEFVGGLGWLSILLPFPIVLTYLLMLMSIVLAKNHHAVVPRRDQLILIAITAASVISIFILLWIYEGSGWLIRDLLSTGRGTFNRFQGRYLVPLAFPFLLSLTGRKLWLNSRQLVALACTVTVVSNVTALYLIRCTYYV